MFQSFIGFGRTYKPIATLKRKVEQSLTETYIYNNYICVLVNYSKKCSYLYTKCYRFNDCIALFLIKT
mgnify:CR=1 FL=1